MIAHKVIAYKRPAARVPEHEQEVHDHLDPVCQLSLCMNEINELISANKPMVIQKISSERSRNNAAIKSFLEGSYRRVHSNALKEIEVIIKMDVLAQRGMGIRQWTAYEHGFLRSDILEI
ncbi:MAG: hypothetical protein ABR889_02830 [Acidobacteriaceae bacterium]